MQYVVCYDISDDRRRDRMARTLLDFGTRVQESVFVANLEDEQAERMRKRIGKVLSKEADRVHVFVVCAACERRTEVLGDGEVPSDPPFIVI